MSPRGPEKGPAIREEIVVYQNFVGVILDTEMYGGYDYLSGGSSI